MIRTMIVEDEPRSSERVTQMISDYFGKELEVPAIAADLERANERLPIVRPNLVFLDIDLGGKIAFDWLKSIGTIDFYIIFTTAHNKYAVEAFKWSAVDYLLKPIDAEDFVLAVRKFLKISQKDEQVEKIQNLLNNLLIDNRTARRICISTTEGLRFFQQSDIIRFESSGNYTYIYTRDQQRLLVSKTLKDFDDMLADSSFYRVHQSHLINLQFVKFYERGKGGYIKLEDGTHVEVSSRRKEGFMERMLQGW